MNLIMCYRKRASPAGEVTTSFDYFAASGKSKPSRSTPIRSKILPANDEPQSLPKTKATDSNPATKKTPVSKSPRTGRTSSRKRKKPNYAASLDDEDEDDDFKPNIIVDDQVSDDDVFEAEYKSSRNGAKDQYISDEDEDEEIINPTRRTAKTSNGSVVKKNEASDDSDIDMEGLPKPINGHKALRGRKRKSVELDGEEENEKIGVTPIKKSANETKTKSRAKGPTPKKARTAKVEESPATKTEVQDIFDSIPTIRPPTPPMRDESKKFDFRAAAQRSQAPPVSHSKEPPIGAENCLAGLTFVFTGLLDGLDRTEGIELVKRYGGKVTTGPSSKTSYVVLGNDAGPKKLETIAKCNLITINEEGLFELIRRLPANGGDGKAAEKFEVNKKKEEKKIEELAAEIENHEKQAAKEAAATKKLVNTNNIIKPGSSSQANTKGVDSRLWTVKYAPTATSMICGNKTQVDKLQAWLRAWPNNARTKFKKAGKDGHGVFRAVMIHGPPGIGKTTAAHLAAKLEGYDIVESNASDTRSKKLVEVGLRGVLDTTSLLGYFAGDGKRVEVEKKKLVLIMDEVDGMSAGDRGGVGALAAVCKKTHIPMVLICNERRIPKMKPFDHVTYDLPFRRPTIDQIRSRIMTICYREGLKIPSNVVNALIEGTRADIRQVINMLSTAKLDQDVMDFDQSKKMSKSWEKHIILKPWDIVSKIIGGGMFAPSSTSTLNEKIELYFNDHEFSSLMLQENYLGSAPILANNLSGKERVLKLLELTDNAAESISDGDLVDRMIHGSQQQWSLMPTHAVFSFVRPASFISGSQVGGGQTRFTSWLGNNSKQGTWSLCYVIRSYVVLMKAIRQNDEIHQRNPGAHETSSIWRPPRDQTAIPPCPLV